MSEDNKKVRRSPDLPVPEMNEERRKELSNRTIYAKGFPKEATLDDLLQHFKKHEHVDNIIMRKYQERTSKKKMFKGSVFITFKTREQVIKDILFNCSSFIIIHTHTATTAHERSPLLVPIKDVMDVKFRIWKPICIYRNYIIPVLDKDIFSRNCKRQIKTH